MRPARPEGFTQGAVEHDCRVCCPSGGQVRCRGVFGLLVVVGGELAPTIRLGSRLVVLDPRAVVARDSLVNSDPTYRPVPLTPGVVIRIRRALTRDGYRV